MSAELKQNLMKINYGEKIAAEILYFSDDSNSYQIKKGLISVDSRSSKLPKSGILLAGRLPKLQLDNWLSLLDQFNSFRGTDEGE